MGPRSIDLSLRNLSGGGEWLRVTLSVSLPLFLIDSNLAPFLLLLVLSRPIRRLTAGGGEGLRGCALSRVLITRVWRVWLGGEGVRSSTLSQVGFTRERSLLGGGGEGDGS